MHKDRKENVLVIGDSHLPFHHKDYLAFCKQIQKRCKCQTVVHIGDLVDNHAISYHEHDPDGFSPNDEMKEVDKHLVKWFKAFPKLKLCRGNHDGLVDRKAKTVGLPSRCFREYRNIWNFPVGWEDDFEFEIDGVLYKHGTGMSGKYAHVNAAERARQSTVIGHTHATLGVEYLVSSKDCIFGVNCGCGIDRKKYAFKYGRDFTRKPVLGCAIVTDKGRFCQVFPMDL